MQIRLILEQQILNASLDEDSAAACSFYALLPLELTLTDYAAIEKVSDLPQALDIKGEPRGYQAKAGDITYYAPWGNLAIFHKDFSYANGLVRIGQIKEDIQPLRASGPLKVRIEAVTA